MTPLAATATTHLATSVATPIPLLAAALAVLWLLGYAAACAADPFARCPRCKGHGKTLKPNGRVKRWCRRCDGTGLRLRLGRRLFNYLRRLHRDAIR
ncbi:hypothetical protein [Nonomuraea turkmeniaca]|uniref:hypothetical protein n=1 Tax=Nonomuraea turkmeniaca TaxID=103838 RepID=UPI001B885D17|nr:hypothetical protein [Nonomuraea turkmeniaca]